MGFFDSKSRWLNNYWLVGIKLPGLEYNNQKVEAAFRKELVYGEDDRKNYVQAPTIFQLFTGIKFNYHRLFLHYGYFDLWLIMYNQSMIIVPYLLMGPGLFTGAMTLGVLIQTSSAFREVQSSFSLFLQNWTRITELRSIHKRLMEFENAINFKKKIRRPKKSDVGSNEIYFKLFEILFPVFLIIGIGFYLGKKESKIDTKFITKLLALLEHLR